MLNTSKLEDSESPKAADGFQFDSGNPNPYAFEEDDYPYDSDDYYPDDFDDYQFDENDFQPKFWKSTGDFQEISRGGADFQPHSRGGADFQHHSRGGADFQQHSGGGKLNPQKPRDEDDSDYLISQSDEDDYKEKFHSFWYPWPSVVKSTWGHKTKSLISRNYETDFLFNVSLRLSDEQMYAFLANIKELYDGKQTVEETSKKAGEIFGTHNNRDLFPSFQGLVIDKKVVAIYGTDNNRDLFLSFQGFLILSQHPLPKRITTQIDGLQFFLQARRCLSVEQFHAFLSAMQEQNSRLATEDETLRKAEEIFGTDNRDLFLMFQGLLISSHREHSSDDELDRNAKKKLRRLFKLPIEKVRIIAQGKTYNKVIETFGTDQFKSFRELLNPKIQEKLIYGENQTDSVQEKLISFWYSFFWHSSRQEAVPKPIRVAANSLWIAENELLFQVSRRLSDEQIHTLLANLKEVYDGKPTAEYTSNSYWWHKNKNSVETLKKADEIFGTDNRDLFLSFQTSLESRRLLDRSSSFYI